MEIRLRTIIITKKVNCSSKGYIYAFLKLGANPNTSTVVNITTAHNGSELRYHKGKDIIANIKKIQSILVMVLSDFFIYANKATYMVITPETPIAHAPTPPLAATCARNTINVVQPQTIQEKRCGFVFPWKIERIYGKNAINVSAIAIAARNSLFVIIYLRFKPKSWQANIKIYS